MKMSRHTEGAKRIRRLPLLLRAVISGLLLVVWAPSGVSDTLHLRDGQILQGDVLMESGSGYTFREREAGAPRQFSKHVVKFAVYDDPRRAEQALGLAEARSLCRDRALVPVKVLPAKDFGVEAVREKARTGVEVIVISPFSSRTSGDVRNATLAFARTLEADGVAALFLQETKVQHKKLIIVDRRKVLLGSSNLTVAGMASSDNMNVLIESEPFVAEAVSDFEELRSKARKYEALTF